MGPHVDGSPTVLVVAPSERQGSIVEALTGDSDEVRAVTPGDFDIDRQRPVDCLVCVARESEARDDLLPTGIDVDMEPPVVIVAEDPSDAVLARAGANGATVLPASQLDALDATVEQVGTEHLERRETARTVSALDQLFAITDYTVFVKDTEGRHRYLSDNPELPDPEVAIGKTDRALYDSRYEFGNQWYDDDMAVLETGDPIVGEVETYDDGYDNEIHNRVSVVPWHDGDRLGGVVGIRHEVTDQITQNTELQRKNRKLDRFVDYLSHDLQTPLQIASGYLELAREGNEDALDRVESALGRIDNLVDDMAALAREDHGAHRSPRRHALAEVLEAVWEPLDTGEATLVIDVPEGASLHAELTELRPFLENLLKNSLDHGPADVTITVSTLNDGFYLEDDGPGIPEAHRDTIFQQGFTTADRGSGTGLSIVAEAADTHRWDVAITESETGGARFEIHNCLLVTPPATDPAVGESLSLTDNCDVGDPEATGTTVFETDGKRAKLRGGGADIYGSDNEFQFAYTEVTGDVRIRTHISEFDARHSFSKAGVMLRDSLAEDAVHAHVGRTPEYGTELLWRTADGESTGSQHLQERYDYEWFRIDRRSDSVTCWVSQDGSDWLLIDQRSVPVEDPYYVGLAVSSVVPRNLATGWFDDIAIHRLDDS